MILTEMGLHEDLSQISRLDATSAMFGLVQGGDIQSASLHDSAHDDYPGVSGLPEEIMGLLEALGHSDEYVRGAGLGALLLARTLIQYAEADKLQTGMPGTSP